MNAKLYGIEITNATPEEIAKLKSLLDEQNTKYINPKTYPYPNGTSGTDTDWISTPNVIYCNVHTNGYDFDIAKFAESVTENLKGYSVKI